MRVLFILKKNETYGFRSYTRRSSGLWNSTRFIVESLCRQGVKAEIVEVVDNNDIDRMVKAHKPDLVVIEALWVVPEKFDVLQDLHPSVKWFVHLHSHMAFLALEGIAMQWVRGYADRGIQMIANSPESFDALRCLLDADEITFLPNVYLPHEAKPVLARDHGALHIGCFGAVRPMKNHLLQALAAIKFARSMGRPLKFHINSTRLETLGEPVLKNLEKLFENQPDLELVEQPWYEPEEFLDLLSNMDLGMQVSLTETFNVVTADYLTAGLPIVVSKEIKWVSRLSRAKDDSVESMVAALRRAYRWRWLIRLNQRWLRCHSMNSQQAWLQWVYDQRDQP